MTLIPDITQAGCGDERLFQIHLNGQKRNRDLRKDIVSWEVISKKESESKVFRTPGWRKRIDKRCLIKPSDRRKTHKWLVLVSKEAQVSSGQRTW